MSAVTVSTAQRLRAAELAKKVLAAPAKTADLAINHVAEMARAGELSPRQVAALRTLIGRYEQAPQSEAGDPQVRGLDLAAKYSLEIHKDGFVVFTLPAGTSYLQLFVDANTHCAGRYNGRPHRAVAIETADWAANFPDSRWPTPAVRRHEILGVVPGTTDLTRESQKALLMERGLSWPSVEAAMAAAALYFCATGKDLFKGHCVVAAVPGVGLSLGADGLFVSELDRLTPPAYVPNACAGERKCGNKE